MKTKNLPSLRLGAFAGLGAFAAASFAPAPAPAETTFYSAAANVSGYTASSITQAVVWCSDAACKNALDPQPVPAADDGTNYVFVANKKLDSRVHAFAAKAFLGSDGTTPAESGTASSGLRSNGSATFDFADLTLVKGSYSCNSTGISKFRGRMTVATTGFSFGGDGIARNDCRGVTIESTLVGDDSARINFTTSANASFLDSLGTNGGYLYSAFAITGDASGYKGKYKVAGYGDTAQRAQGEFWSQLRLESASAFGDTSVTNADAVTLGNFSYVAIGPDVVQSAARGITLSLTGDRTFAGVTAAAGETWTLTTPVVCTKGIFAKRDLGTVRLNGSVAAANVLVRAGTLILGPDYQPPETQTITVASGATLAFERSADSLPGVTIVREDGSTLANYLDVPYDGTNTTPVVFADGYTFAEDTIFPVTLSQKIALPFTETNRLAVAVLTNGTVDVARFVNRTEKYYSLPFTWFESETDPETKVQTVYLVARPAIRAESVNARIGRVSYGTPAKWTWTDHLVDHSGADYYTDTYALRTADGSNLGKLNFGGESLTLIGKSIADYIGVFTVNDLRMYGSSGISLVAATSSSGAYSSGVREREVAGSVHLAEGAKCDFARANATNMMAWSATLTGSGTLNVYDGWNNVYNATTPCKLYAMSPDFEGTIQIYSAGSGNNLRPIEVSVTNALAFGGSPKAFKADAVILDQANKTATNTVVVRAEADIAVTNQLRGWTISTATLRADKGVTFALSSPLVVKNELRKDGEGTLALGTCPTGAGKTFRVWEGFVQPLIATCCTNQNLLVADGAGVHVAAGMTDADVAAYGLRALSILPESEDAKIVAKVDLPAGFTDYGTTVAVCTVSADQADLTANFAVKPPKGYSGKIVKTVLDGEDAGFVTYTAEIERKGLRLIVK